MNIVGPMVTGGVRYVTDSKSQSPNFVTFSGERVKKILHTDPFLAVCWKCSICYHQKRTTTVIKMAYELNEQKKIGLGLIGFGITFSFLGVILFFDRGLLALGNIFCLTGVALLLGWHSTWNLFTNRANYKGSASFLLGLFFLFVRWPIVGIIFEIYGCIVLFGGFWPSVKVFLYQIPVLGWIIQYPFLLLDRLFRGSG
ncbi:vesicle transport protein GOT1 [Carya illinoinensis]|nr:vesicle transport protein GOT1 [Carya illinoinensis]